MSKHIVAVVVLPVFVAAAEVTVGVPEAIADAVSAGRQPVGVVFAFGVAFEAWGASSKFVHFQLQRK